MQLHELLDKAYHYQYYLLILVCYLISKIKLRGHLAQKYLEMIYFSFHRSLNLSDEDLKKLAHLQAIAVHPHFRGYGLQRKLAAAHLKVLERTGYEHICCTVSPKNPRYSTGKSILGDKRLIPHHLIAILARSTRSITLSPPPPSLRFLIHSGQEVTI